MEEVSVKVQHIQKSKNGETTWKWSFKQGQRKNEHILPTKLAISSGSTEQGENKTSPLRYRLTHPHCGHRQSVVVVSHCTSSRD